MSDLERLGAMLAKPAPSRDVVERGRLRLQQKMDGPVRRRRAGWFAGGLGLAAAAAAVVVVAVVVAAVVAASPPSAPRADGGSSSPQSPPPTAIRMSGRQVLLAAAVAAESKHPESGTYWHVKLETRFPGSGNSPGNAAETWIRRDGRAWSAMGRADTVSEVKGLYFLDETDTTFAQIQRLPTDPTALKAWVVRLLKRYPAATGTDSDVIALLTDLLYQSPSPPKVRAAAFRAIASYPNVKSLGRLDGGWGLLILDHGSGIKDHGSGVKDHGSGIKLVVDPATSLVRAKTFVEADGTERLTTTVVTAEWTNLLPRVVAAPLPTPRAPLGPPGR